jgi:hypothetical protein
MAAHHAKTASEQFVPVQNGVYARRDGRSEARWMSGVVLPVGGTTAAVGME